MEEQKHHPAISFVQVGRGRGITLVPVVTFGSIGRSTMLHILQWNEALGASTLCGKKDGITEIYDDADPKAVRIGGANVCYSCRRKLGNVPMPHLKTDTDPLTERI